MYPDETPRWRRYLRFWGRDVASDVDDELSFHFQERVEELLAQGLSAEAARERAVREFGDVGQVRADLRAIDERMARRARVADTFHGWLEDIAYAWRSIRRTPVVSITIIATLALGLGANAAMFSLLNAVFLRPPGGVERPDQVSRLWTGMTFRSGFQFWPGYSYEEYQAIRDAIGGIGTTAIYRAAESARLGPWPSAESTMLSFASSDAFPLLGTRPALGRFFLPDEDRLGAGVPVAVVSYSYWQRSLGGDSSVLGREILLDGRRFTVVGVTESAFSGPDLSATDIWVPLATLNHPNWWNDRNVNGFQILVRRRDGVSLDMLGARATPAIRRGSLRFRRDSLALTRAGSIIAARGPGDELQEVKIATRLAGVSLIVLLIACANVINLLLARAVRRRREIALRRALGMSRARLTRLVMTESVMLALFAGAAAIVAAEWGGLALRALLLPAVRWAHGPVDWRVLLGALAATLIAGVLAGAAPALKSGTAQLTDVLKAGAREGFVRRSRTRSLLVIAQAALSVVLLLGAGLFVRSLSNVRSLDIGFDASKLLYAGVAFESGDAARDSAMPDRLAQLAERLRHEPGVQGAALTAMRPMLGFSWIDYYPDSDTLAHPKPMGMFWAVSPGYFSTVGTQLISGSDFPSAGGASAPLVIINEAMSSALWPNQSALGRCIRFEDSEDECYSITGVVENAHWGALIEKPTPQLYLPIENVPMKGWDAHELAIRANESDMPMVTSEVRNALRQEFPGGVPRIVSMSKVMEPDFRPWTLGATLFLLFGALAALVAVIGAYSSVSYSVNMRTHELGVRVALGARFSHVIRHVLSDGMRLVAVGVVIGAILSLAGGRFVASQRDGVSPHDPLALSLVAAGLLLVAGLAMLIPAWRAARVQPMAALRVE
jgi:predicted permease